MSNVTSQSKVSKNKSVSTKISISLLAVLVPSLLILIIVSCLMASTSVTELNRNNLNAQTDNAVSIVDGFFTNKVTAAQMFAKDPSLQTFFKNAATPAQMNDNPVKGAVLSRLTDVLNRMQDENVQQTWVASLSADTFLLSTGDTVAAGFADLSWDEDLLSTKDVIITEPFVDPATGERVISIVSPVFSPSGSEITGLMGMDVFVTNLAESLKEIKVGNSGFVELLSNSSDYIYTDDPANVGKNVDALGLEKDYVDKIKSKYQGEINFHYLDGDYKSITQSCKSTGWLVVSTIPMDEVNATRDQLVVVLAILSLVILAVLVAIILMIVHKTMRPLAEISADMEEFANGNLGVDIKIHSEDEIGRLADSARTAIHVLRELITDVSHILTEISNGNLQITVNGNYVGDLIPIRTALERIIFSLNDTLRQINTSADQVLNGSEQVSNGAQALSQGAAEQASSVEELAATINEISGQISDSAQNAANASEKAGEVGGEATQSNQRMQDMLNAMQEISDSSNQIGKIIKTIEDIAFQTNILALNAAVEAARAGEAGKGFAVVADEVRNLASKSAEASKSTAALIENSLHAVENGTRIADETALSLHSVVEGVNEVTETINNVSAASGEQARAVKQVAQGIDQISSVVQTNSATAEESAAASEELSGQSQLLKELVGKFRISTTEPAPEPAPEPAGDGGGDYKYE